MTSTPDSAADSSDAVVAQLGMWQLAAQQLPLPEVREMANDFLAHFGCCLNDLNTICDSSPDTPDTERCTDCGLPATICDAVNVIIRQACAAAIFTLGAVQRTRALADAN